MELREYIQIIRKRVWIVIVLLIMSILVSGYLSYFVLDKIYAASTTLIVSGRKDPNAASNPIQYNDILLNQKLVKSYSLLATSDRVMTQVIDELNLNMKTQALGSKITVKSMDDTEIIKITAEDKVPAKAQAIANSLAKVFKDEVKAFLLMDNVQIIDTAPLPDTPVKPNHMLNIIMAALISIVAGFGIILLIEYLDNTVKTPDDIEKFLELPLLGTIPRIR